MGKINFKQNMKLLKNGPSLFQTGLSFPSQHLELSGCIFRVLKYRGSQHYLLIYMKSVTLQLKYFAVEEDPE